jgi:hypothetical protein
MLGVIVVMPLSAQEPGTLLQGRGDGKTEIRGSTPRVRNPVRRKRQHARRVIPPMTVLHNPEYLSGEASVSVAANSNPLIRIGMAQNGVTLVEFPSADRFFAVHAGNSDLVTVEKSPSLKRDHHLILRAGSGFLAPRTRTNGAQAAVPATSIIAQMDSGMAITLMIYPVPLLKQQVHRLVIKYSRDEVVGARRAAGLAINLVVPEPAGQTEVAGAQLFRPVQPSTEGIPIAPTATTFPPQREVVKRPKTDYHEPVGAALKEAIKNPEGFRNWAAERHGLMIATLPPRDLSDTVRLVVLAVRNAGRDQLRLISGYPDLYVETLNEKHRPVEAGTRVEKLQIASSGSSNLIQPGATIYFAVAYEAPILGVRQHLKIVVAQMSAADEPAMADLTAVAR